MLGDDSSELLAATAVSGSASICFLCFELRNENDRFDSLKDFKFFAKYSELIKNKNWVLF